jgi:hypothetical protein
VDHLLSGHRIVLYLGIVLAYLVIISLLIKRETNIGLRQLDLNELAERLGNAKSLFAVGTMRFDEWFDPAVQVYLSTIFERKLQTNPFRYERTLLLSSRSARENLNSDYLDGYHAKSLIGLHKRLGIPLYFLEWPQIITILRKLSSQERVLLDFYPPLIGRVPDFLARIFVSLNGRRKVRKLAVAVIQTTSGSTLAFRFSKSGSVVSVQFEPQDRKAVCEKFVRLIQEEIYEPGTVKVQPKYDFTRYY